MWKEVGHRKNFEVNILVVSNLVHILEEYDHFHMPVLDSSFHSLHQNYCDYTLLDFLVHLPRGKDWMIIAYTVKIVIK